MDWIQVQGTSMRPFLSPGDEVAIEWWRPQVNEIPRRGEILLAQEAGNVWTVHRVVQAQTHEYITVKGDAAFACGNVSMDKLWGRVVAVKRVSSGLSSTFKANMIDRLIALLSLRTLPYERLLSRFLRKIIFVMACFRRWI
ncbi:MAG: S24/S26 family peptidase [Bdellovibrionota bacterium]